MALVVSDVTEAELAVLRALWNRQDASIRELAENVYPDGGATGYATVQKLLERLESKGCVRRDRAGLVHRFRALVDREQLIERRLLAVAESLCEGSLTPLLSQLVRHSGKFTSQDRAVLQELIDRLDTQRSGRSESTQPSGRSR